METVNHYLNHKYIIVSWEVLMKILIIKKKFFVRISIVSTTSLYVFMID